MKFIIITILYFLFFTNLFGVEEFVHDPSKFFLYDDRLIGYSSGTNGIALQGLELVLKEGIVERTVPVFEDKVPEWIEKVQIWNYTGELDAPSTFNNGKYIFYTVTDETDIKKLEYNIQDAIGVVENKGTPDEPEWNDLGIVVKSFGENLDIARAMDPSIIEFNERIYLIFGSHAGGIFLTELSKETMKLKNYPKITSTLKYKSRFVFLAQNFDPTGEESEIEAPFIYKKGDYFYLFVNWGKCCRGIYSTYNIRVGRSLTINGPYFDKDQKNMAVGGGSIFLNSEDRFIGPGHTGIFKIEDLGELITYHFYDGEEEGISKLAVREIFWNENGWPKLGEHLISPNQY